MCDGGGNIEAGTSSHAVSDGDRSLSLEDADRFLRSGDEAGTAPGDRKFRPDVEGLRAVAIVLVVLFHAGVPRLTGGYVGVDVFFVLSGFVITGLLLENMPLQERPACWHSTVAAAANPYRCDLGHHIDDSGVLSVVGFSNR